MAVEKTSKDKRSRAERRRMGADQAVAKPDRDWQWFWFISGGALLLRLIYLIEISDIPLFYELAGDARTYHQWGGRIAAGDWLGQGVFYQAPLYPYFLGVLQTIFGDNLWLIRFLQILMGSVSCGLIYLVGRRLFSPRAGIIAGVLLATYGPAIFFDGLIEKSILDLFLIALLFWQLTEPAKNNPSGRWLALGIIVALLSLSRENALVLIPILLLWITLHESPAGMQARWRSMGLFVLGLVLVLGPVGVRNYVAGGEFKLTTSQFGPNFFIGNNPKADGTYESVRQVIHEVQLEGNDARRLAEQRLGRALTAGEVSDYWAKHAWDFIQNHPIEWFHLLVRKGLMVWNVREVEDSDDFYIYQRWSTLLAVLGTVNHFGVLAPLAFAGIWFTAGSWRRLWWLYLMVVSFAAAVAVFYVFGRYRYPLVPMLTLFAGAGVSGCVDAYRNGTWRPCVAPALAIFIGAIVVNWPLMQYSGPGPGGYPRA